MAAGERAVRRRGVGPHAARQHRGRVVEAARGAPPVQVPAADKGWVSHGSKGTELRENSLVTLRFTPQFVVLRTEGIGGWALPRF